MRGVVTPHDALQFGKLADHVGQQIGLGQQRGALGLLDRKGRRNLPGNAPCERLHPPHALALRAQLGVIDHFVEAGHAVFEALLAVLLEEELRIGQARAHHALVAFDDRAGIGRRDIADDQETVGELARRVEQRKVFLVGLHREDEALLRHGEKGRIELAQQHVRALDQSSNFVEQRGIVDGVQARPGLSRGGLQLRRDFSTARVEAGDHRALFSQLVGVAVGVAQHDGIGLGLKPMAVRFASRRQPQRLHRHDVDAMQGDQTMRGAHKLHRSPAIFQLVGHHLGDGQFGDGLGERPLQTFGQRGAGRHGVDEQGFGFALAFAPQAGGGVGIQPQRAELFEQRRGGLAVGIQPHGHGHELLRYGLVGRLGSDGGDAHGQSARAGVGRRLDVRCGQSLRPQTRGQGAGEGLAQRGQRLGRQFFNEEFDKQVLWVHGGQLQAAAGPRQQRGHGVRQTSGGFLLGELGRDFVGPGAGRQRETQTGATVEVFLRHAARQVANAADVGGAFGDGNRAASVEQIEAVRRLEYLFVSGQRQLRGHQRLGLLFMRGEGGQQKVHIAVLEVVGALLDFVLVEHVAVFEKGTSAAGPSQGARAPLGSSHFTGDLGFGPDEVVHALHALQIHGQALQAVGDLAGQRLAVDAADLLEIGELGDFHAVEPDLPAQPPGAQRGVFPVIFNEADIVGL